MKLRYFLTSIVACLALAIGCTKEELPGLSEIQVTPSYFTFGVDGGAKEITVTAVADWTVSDVPEWLTVSPASGSATDAEGVKVTVTAAPTTSEKVVAATIKFNCAGKSQLVTVGQEAYVPDYPKFKAGEYWIMFGEEVAVPVTSDYGYLYTAKANKSDDGKLSSTADNIFTFTEVEGGFSIQDAAGKFYAMKGTYTSFNLYDTAQESYVYTVKQTGDDKFVITNANGKVMQYDPAYSSAGAYDSEKTGAIYPNLVSVAGAEIAEILFAVEPTEVALEQAAGEFNINMTCKNDAFEIKPSVDWITVKGMTSTKGEYVVTFSYEANDGSARTATIDFVSAGETITVAVTQKGSAIVEVSVADFLKAEVGPALYKLTGKIANIAMDKNDPTKVNAYGNFDLVDATGSVYVYGLTSTPQASNDKSFASLGLKEGDIVTIVGTRAVHNDTPQVGGPAYYVSHVAGGQEPEQPAAPTIASVLALGKNATVPANTVVEGFVISNMDLNNLTSKKGMYVQDETAGLQFYLAANHEFKFGDKVKVDLSGAKIAEYNGAIQISGLALDKITKVSSGNTVTAKTVTIADFLANKYEGQYVAIEGVQVVDADLSKTWVSGGAHTSIKIENAEGKNFVVFSSKYATYGTSTVAQGSGTIKGISSINNGNMQLIFAQNSDYAGLTGARLGQGSTEPEPDQPETPAATNRADFETFPEKYGQYTKEFTSAAGWHTVNCAIQEGYTSDINPQFICIGKVPGTDTWAKAVCINGKTSASGVLESPELTGGCGVLSFNYGNMFSESKGVSFKVEVIQNGAVVKEVSFTKDNASVPKLTKLEGSLDINVSGTFKLRFTNNSPTNSTSNKDRVSIWNLTWTSVQ